MIKPRRRRMTKILTLDASTEACSVALCNGEQVSSIYQLAPRMHANLLLPMVEEMLLEQKLSLSELDAIACHVGPGAFTGIRIAVSIVQGLAYAAKLPVISLSSLANLAEIGFEESGREQSEWLCAIDARMNEVYFAHYKAVNGTMQLVGEEQVVAPDLIDYQTIAENLNCSNTDPKSIGETASIGLIGSGWQAYSDILFSNHNPLNLKETQLFKEAYPNAKYGLKQALKLFQQDSLLKPEELQPTYLRNNVAVKKA
jgi:tRNA threonylcarbamoyladenosine biosynthesis protein TsaB